MNLVHRRADYSVTTATALSAKAPANVQHCQVPAELAGMRLDQALARMFPEHSRSRLQAWIRAQRVRVDGAAAQPRDKVWGGEQIELTPDRSGEPSPDAPQALPLAIVHEDAAILVVDKPAGLVVHPGSGNRDGTLLNALLHHAPQLAEIPRAGIVHRLDKQTSGLLVVAKTPTAQTSLVRQLQARTVKRDYWAIVLGRPPQSGTVEAPIGRHRLVRTRMAVVATGKPAVTHYRVVKAGDGWSLLHCSLETGRTHQIRVHLAAIGHPLLGDPVYLGRAEARAVPAVARGFRRQALHAQQLALEHPDSGVPLTFQSPLPLDLTELLDALEQNARAR